MTIQLLIEPIAWQDITRKRWTQIHRARRGAHRTLCGVRIPTSQHVNTKGDEGAGPCKQCVRLEKETLC
jgi:hypothetical protein